MSPPNGKPTTYPVEISGWDVTQTFFVEKTDLAWSEQEGKRIWLRHVVHDGALVFVRLLDSAAQQHSFPVAYRVGRVPSGDGQGVCEFRLTQIKPRDTEADEELPVPSSTTKGQK